MRYYQDFNHKQALYDLIQKYAVTYGVSIIPTNGKRPAVRWKEFQQQAPSLRVLDDFFNPQRFIGYDAAAIITGRVSDLVVVDFDTRDAFYAFREVLPDLVQENVIQTRRGFHVYLHVPDHLPMPQSRSSKDVDLQGPGRYVIMQGSKIDGFSYQRYLGPNGGGVNQRLPLQFHEVTAADLEKLDDYLAQLPRRSPQPPKAPERPSQPVEAEKPAEGQSAPAAPMPESILDAAQSPDRLTIEDLQNLYLRFAPQMGRNNTLFYIASLGRDHYFSLEEMKKALTRLHIQAPPPLKHPHETVTQRRREAERTIGSAFSYRRQAIRQRVLGNPDQLPNTVRETLLRQKQTDAIRLIEGLRLKGIGVGEPFTEREAVEALSGIVGRYSIRGAIEGLRGVLQPSPHTPLPAAYGGTDDIAFKSSLPTELSWRKFGVQKPDKTNSPGRPPQIYLMPSNENLARWLSVKNSNIRDLLSLDDLKSAKRVRQALHRRFIERKPDTYNLGLLQYRLGMCRRTVQNYNNEDPMIIRTIQFHTTALDWENFKYVMPDFRPHPGCFIQDKYGNRYPYQSKIVVELLKARKEPRYCRQIANHYRYLEPRPTIRPKIQDEVPAKPPPPRRFKLPEVNYIEIKPPSKPKSVGKKGSPPKPVQPPLKPAPRAGDQKPKQRPDRETYREPLPNADEEALAQRVREQINAMTEDLQDRATIVATRRLVWRHKMGPVVKSMEVVRKRRNVRKPIGFLSTILRCGDY